MQRGDYPMFIFTSHRKPMAPDSVVRSANLSESLLESTRSGFECELEKTQGSARVQSCVTDSGGVRTGLGDAPNVASLSCSPPTEEYVVL